MLKQIDNTLPLPKYYQIGESIKEKIAAGQYRPGDKIPTCRELSGYFNTTLVTVSNAMRQLENDGYISKIQGKGMFVTIPATINDKADNQNAIKKVGLAMHSRGDLYQNLVEVLVHDLEKHDIYTVPLPTIEPNTNFYLEENCLKKYIANGLDALVMDGTRHMSYKLLHKYRADFRQLNFLMHYNSIIDFPDANIITYDYAMAGRMAAEHLLKAGRKKFIFITYYNLSDAERKRNGCKGENECHDMIMLSGMKAVFQEAGIPDSSLTVIKEEAVIGEQNITNFTKLLKNGSWGILVMGDSRAVQIYRAATMMGLNIKQNISIVGCYNTSWAEVLYPRLTSISINETEIAHLAADCIINRKIGQRIVIEPRLIVRET